jgi:hypothetical protein
MSALPELSNGGHVEAHMTSVVTTTFGDGVVVANTVVRLGVDVLVEVAVEHATSATGGFAATPMGLKIAPEF